MREWIRTSWTEDTSAEKPRAEAVHGGAQRRGDHRRLADRHRHAAEEGIRDALLLAKGTFRNCVAAAHHHTHVSAPYMISRGLFGLAPPTRALTACSHRHSRVSGRGRPDGGLAR